MGWFDSKKSPLLEDDIESATKGEPSVYLDGRRLMDVAMAMYLLPDLRKAAALGKLDTTSEAVERITTLPCTPWDMNQLFKTQGEILEEILGKSDYNAYSSALSAKAYTNDEDLQEKVLKSTEILILDDATSDFSLVYAMAVSHLTSRIYVVFRGSVTVRDFLQDAKMHMGSISNPAFEHDKNLPRFVGVHSGFREYLYETDEKEEHSKFGVIIDQLIGLINNYPNYKIYIGGHSLGGALATLLAFETACMEEVPKPVTAIPTASPKVGNKSFLHSFEALEKLGYLRYLHIANDRDIVTLSPSASAFFSMFTFFCQNRVYRSVGLRLVLSPGSYSWTFPPKVRNFALVGFVDMLLVARNWLYLVFVYPFVLAFGVMCCCCSKRGSLAEEHSCETYFERFDQFKEDLEAVTISDLYEARKNRAWWRTSSLPKTIK